VTCQICFHNAVDISNSTWRNSQSRDNAADWTVGWRHLWVSTCHSSKCVLLLVSVIHTHTAYCWVVVSKSVSKVNNKQQRTCKRVEERITAVGTHRGQCPASQLGRPRQSLSCLSNYLVRCEGMWLYHEPAAVRDHAAPKQTDTVKLVLIIESLTIQWRSWTCNFTCLLLIVVCQRKQLSAVDWCRQLYLNYVIVYSNHCCVQQLMDCCITAVTCCSLSHSPAAKTTDSGRTWKPLSLMSCFNSSPPSVVPPTLSIVAFCTPYSGSCREYRGQAVCTGRMTSVDCGSEVLFVHNRTPPTYGDEESTPAHTPLHELTLNIASWYRQIDWLYAQIYQQVNEFTTLTQTRSNT